MLNINKKKVFTLFTLSSLIMVSLLAGAYIPASAQLPSDILYLDGPSLTPIHMDGPSLTPIHMHSPLGIIDLYDPMGTPWHELYPNYCESWTYTSWEDNGNGYLDSSDQIDMTNDVTQEVRWYHVDRVTMTLGLWSEDYQESIYVEYKGPYDPYIFPISTLWHEVWPVYHGVFGPGIPYHIIDWIDNGSGFLDYCDYIMFEAWPGIWWHVEEFATDLILNEKVMDPIGIEWHELYPSYCNFHDTTSWEEPIEDAFPGRLSPGDQIDMVNLTTQETKWYYVDRVTFTMLVANETDPDDWMYIEYKGPFETMYDIKTTVINSTWHEVYPVYCPSFNITGWQDNCNGVLDSCDYIELHDLYADLYYGWWHVEDLAIDIILNEKIGDPTGIIWHELYPDCCINDYVASDWEDDGNGLLDPSDNITLSLLPTGLTEEYQIEHMTLTLNLSILDMAGSPPFTIGEQIYIEYLYAIDFGWEWLYYPKTHPLYTDWAVVCPNDYFDYFLTIETWLDNCNGVLSYCDLLELTSHDGALFCHVDDVNVDIAVKEIGPTLVHDVAVIDIFSIYDWVYQGDIDPINVTVENQGDYTELADVTAYYNGVPAAPTQAVLLDPGDIVSLMFNWDTTGVPTGFYQVSADAIIPQDDDPNDNFMTGNTEEVKLRPPWYKKPPYPDYAPYGMPDFDQKQPGWSTMNGWTHCGPVAVANSLWWFDSQYEPNTIGPPAIIDNFPLVTAYGKWDDHDPQNVVPLVNNLAFLMDTDGMRTGLVHTGTNYIDMQTGISQYLQQQGINPVGDCDGDGDVDTDDHDIIVAAFMTAPGMLGWDMRADIVIDNIVDIMDEIALINNFGAVGMFYEHTEDFPDFYFIEEEVERCQDVVLLLTFWMEVEPDIWIPVEYPFDLPSGGHYVTVAGVNSTTEELVLSDPWWDAAEAGFWGDVPNPHHGHLGNVTVHNDAQFVSHDAYGVFFWPGPPPLSPYPFQPVWELVGYLQQLGYPPQFRAFIRAAVITSPLAGHDVAVTNVTTSKAGCLPMETVGNGTTCNVTATFENQGGFTETFNATVKAGATVIGAQVVVLNAGQNITITFVWDTTSFAHGDYLISAEASVVPGETDTADNTMNYGTVRVTWKGDVDGDGDVDIFDIVRMATIYGVVKPNPSYDPNCDIDNDGDIDIFDIVAAATNYGKGT